MQFSTCVHFAIAGVTYRGRAADVWALGCTLYCMVLGRYPFVGDTLQGTYERVCLTTSKCNMLVLCYVVYIFFSSVKVVTLFGLFIFSICSSIQLLRPFLS